MAILLTVRKPAGAGAQDTKDLIDVALSALAMMTHRLSHVISDFNLQAGLAGPDSPPRGCQEAHKYAITAWECIPSQLSGHTA